MDKDDRFTKGIFYILIFMGIVLAGTILKILDAFFKPVVLSILI